MEDVWENRCFAIFFACVINQENSIISLVINAIQSEVISCPYIMVNALIQFDIYQLARQGTIFNISANLGRKQQ